MRIGANAVLSLALANHLDGRVRQEAMCRCLQQSMPCMLASILEIFVVQEFNCSTRNLVWHCQHSAAPRKHFYAGFGFFTKSEASYPTLVTEGSNV